MTVLVTGFEPFGGDGDNPSADVVAGLRPRPDLVTAILPVSYRRIGTELGRLLDRVEPSAVMLVGLGEAAGVRFEQFAVNLDDTPSADNDGEVRTRRPILTDGPVAYRPTLPLEDLAALAADVSVPVEWSRDAGGFLCNHVFFSARHLTEQHDIPCGFIHVGRATPVDQLVPFFDRAVAILADGAG